MKKRLVFTLLYEKGHFVLSRNFRTQKIGGVQWLVSHYNFAKSAQFIDELILINVSGDPAFDEPFRETLSEVASGIFVPIAAGGGITKVEDATKLFNSGADKVIVNQAIFTHPSLVIELAKKFGQQSVVGSVDVSYAGGNLEVFTHKASQMQPVDRLCALISQEHLGELYVNSIDRDGTGQGMDSRIAEMLCDTSQIPVILAGGAGKPEHLVEAIKSPHVDAVATANLLNFVGDGLRKSREAIVNSGVDLANWNYSANLANG